MRGRVSLTLVRLLMTANANWRGVVFAHAERGAA